MITFLNISVFITNKISPIILILITFWLISCSPSYLHLNNTKNYLLKRKINNLIIESEFDASIGIDIRSLETSQSLYSYHKNKPFTPASNIKLYTSLTSLIKLGLDYKFETTIYRKNDNLFIKGGGDPNFTLNNLDSLAKLISVEISNIDTIIADETILDSNQFGPGWMWDEGHWWHAAPISALSLNDNCISFFVRTEKIGKPLQIEIFPNTKYVKIINNSTTVFDSLSLKKFTINRDWKNQNNIFTISGNKIQTQKIDTLKRNISNPALYTATIFAERLNNYNIQTKHIKTGQTPIDAIPIFKNTSKSLLKINKRMMYDSNNLTAEILTKTLSINDTIPGNWKMGLKIIKSILADSTKIDTSKINIADGSGLSRYNLSSAQNFTILLDYIYHSKYSEYFISSLPYGGSNSTLKERLINSNLNIRAKTGSLSGISCLSGYIFSKQYGPLAFSILINGYIGSSAPYKDFQDKILTFLLN